MAASACALMDLSVDKALRFERFALDLERECLRVGGQEIELRPKAFDVLRHLAANAGRLVRKDELHEAVWPNVTVSDDSLVQCIRELRSKLGDEDHALIKTVSRRGYLLDARPASDQASVPTALAGEMPAPGGSGAPSVPAAAGGPPTTAGHPAVALRRHPLTAAGIAMGAIAAAYLLVGPTAPTGRIETPLANTSAVTTAAPSLRPTVKDCDVCPEMVELPAGEFMMGSPDDEPGRKQVEGPPRRVVISKRFALGKFEVTVEQFSAFAAETGFAGGNVCHVLIGFDSNDFRWSEPRASFREPGFDVTSTHPVVCVSWHEAQAYAAWLGRRTGKPYRLPTEAEWEYAARAGTTTSYSFGANQTLACAYARFTDLNSKFGWRDTCRSGFVEYGTLPVGTRLANPWGLFDMHGNAWEWVQDCWTLDAREIPVDGSAFMRSGGCEFGVLRGGSFVSDVTKLRSAQRGPWPVGAHDQGVGFRVALPLDP